MPKESSVEGVKRVISQYDPRHKVVTVASFEIVISHTDQYIAKSIPYLVLALFPIILIIGHWRNVTSTKLSIHVLLFTGVAILLITSFFGVRLLLPRDITLLEIVMVGIVAIYSSWFYRKLRELKNSDCKCEHKILR